MLDFKAAIFDLDGTLLDSMDVWIKTDIKFLAKRNFEVPEGYSNKVCAMSFRETVEYTIALFGLDETPEDMMDELYEMVLYEYSHNVDLKAHARDYLIKLKSLGIKLAVATSLPELLFTPALQNNGIYDLFDALCSTNEVTRSKAHPDIFLLAAEKLSVGSDDCIVFEDIAPASLAAKSCGMKVFGVYDKHCEHFRDEIMNAADGYIYDWKDAPIPVNK